VFCAKFSGDATYVLTGSDDTNIRIWKAKASEQLGVVRKGYSQLVIVSFFAMY
jgi:WD40 repeat protein